ncbi:SH3 domain-containing protein [Salmonella enterica subsp. diarizonae serovar 60:r:e,n,x,z15]|nr:SH3 domain-containing protein [Salmonella enterica subsp. diarizonae serovar 60:r:e,n,x,z15]
MNMRLILTFLFMVSASGCKAPQQITDDTVVSSQVNGFTLKHRYIVRPPAEFTPVNDDYRALYPALLMSRPDFGGKVIHNLVTGRTYVALGTVEHSWMALAEKGRDELIGYVPMRAVVRSELYDKIVREQSRRAKVRKKTTCVNVDGNTRACKNGNNGTWILN